MVQSRRRSGWVTAGMVAIAVTICGCSSVDAASTQLNGTYSWQSTVGPLEGSFAPTDTPGEFKAKFRFQFNGKWKTWRGVVRGNLFSGPIEGRVEGQGRRAWNLRGSVEDGVLKATHFEIEGDGEFETGTLELRPE